MEYVLDKYFSHSYLNETNGKITGIIKSEMSYNDFFTDLACQGFTYITRNSRETNQPQKLNGGGSNAPVPRVIKFDLLSGLPYYNRKYFIMECIHGKKVHQSTKQNVCESTPGQNTRCRVKSSKKLGCGSQIHIRVRRMFTEECYQGAATFSQRTKKKITDRLCMELKNTEDIQSEEWYFLEVSKFHNHELTTQATLHPDLKSRIFELVSLGTVSVPDVKVKLQETVNEMFKDKELPSLTNSAFYPTNRTIYNFIYQALAANRDASSDQDQLVNKIKDQLEKALDVSKNPSCEYDSDSSKIIEQALETTKLLQANLNKSDIIKLKESRINKRKANKTVIKETPPKKCKILSSLDNKN